MSFTDEQIRTIIKDTVSKIITNDLKSKPTGGFMFDDANQAIAAAKAEQK